MSRKIRIEVTDGNATATEQEQNGGTANDGTECPVDEPVGESSVQFEAAEPELSAEESSSEDIGRLAARVAELESLLEAERDLRLRTLADFQNFRRRADEQKVEVAQFANRELILGLLPILDNFERALYAAAQSNSYDALISGVSLTRRQLEEYLQKQGVTPIEAVGQEFDPNLHEAVMRVEDGEHPENTVVEELQRGYTMHSRVVRPSMVKVARSE